MHPLNIRTGSVKVRCPATTKNGSNAIHDNCKAQVVASGGAGKMEHFLEAAKAGATVLLAASVFHFHMIDIMELKKYLKANGVNVKI